MIHSSSMIFPSRLRLPYRIPGVPYRIPLADKFGMDIDTTYGFPEKEALSNMLFARLGTGEMCGKLAVFSWKHHDMTHFAQWVSP